MPKKAGIGDLVRVDWIDAGRYTNSPLSSCKAFRTWNIGYLVKEDGDYLYLETGSYPDDDEEKRDRDITMIPKGFQTKVSVICHT